MASILHLAAMLDCESKNGMTAYMDVLYVYKFYRMIWLCLLVIQNKHKEENFCEIGDCIDLAAIFRKNYEGHWRNILQMCLAHTLLLMCQFWSSVTPNGSIDV